MEYDILEHGSVAEGNKTFFYMGDTLQSGSASMNMVKENVWFFNRLIVHKNLRGKGLGTILIMKVADFCKENNISLVNVMNPYGDLDMEQLKQFYTKHGFVETHEEDTLILLRDGGNIEDDMKN